MTDSGAVRHDLALRIQVHVARSAGRRHLAKVDAGGAAIGQADHGEAAATEIARARVGDGQRHTGGHHGIGGIATTTHHLDADFGGQPAG